LPHGIAEAPIKDGRLCRVLDDYTTPTGGLYVVYPSSRHLSPLVKTFIELAGERISAAGISESDTAVAVSKRHRRPLEARKIPDLGLE
jgi:hypothetical protein